MPPITKKKTEKSASAPDKKSQKKSQKTIQCPIAFYWIKLSTSRAVAAEGKP
jgi:hypothetical protein